MRKTLGSALSVYKTKTFARFAKQARITDADLWNSALLANRGSIDADLGGGILKQRIARSGEGKSGGSRTILVFRREDRAVYVFGFEKKDRDNIDQRQFKVLRNLAKLLLGYDADEMKRQVEAGELIVIENPREGLDV